MPFDGVSGFELNREPLDAYAAANTSAELVQLQFEFFDLNHLIAEGGDLSNVERIPVQRYEHEELRA